MAATTHHDHSHFWNTPLDTLYHTLATAPDGLTSENAKRRLKETGLNQISSERRNAGAAAILLLLKQFNNPLLLILMFALTISAIAGEWMDMFVVLVIVVGSAALSFVQEYNAANAISKLARRVQTQVRVRRSGGVVAIPIEEIVPGDVVELKAGSMIPGDGRIIEDNDCSVDQAVLTGETFPVEKHSGVVAIQTPLNERFNSLFMGTHVRSGTAVMLVVHTGKATAFGAVAGTLAHRPPITEFERGIRQFGYLLIQIILVLVLFVFAVNVLAAKPTIESLLFAIALAVGIAPEMLPAIMTITLSSGAKLMADKHVIVRRLNAIENFGNMDVLCTDKTGTLTEGKITLDQAVNSEGALSNWVMRCAYWNARLQVGIENPLDQAIIAAGERNALDTSGARKLNEIPYDFRRKRLTIILAHEGDQVLFITKGAVRAVLDVCAWVQIVDERVPMDGDRRAVLEARFSAWSAGGSRVIGLATKIAPAQDSYTRDDESNLVFQGFVLFTDPPKVGVSNTLSALKQLGISLKIITGDNRQVAEYTAKQVGLPVSGVLSGKELEDMGADALLHRVERTTLFVEIDPNEKERIIRTLKKAGHVVGYMGDGINDAPALHSADVSISVDQAVDVAKEAADFVLLEHNLDVLRDGIIIGRRTFANTLKYIMTTTSANFGNMFSMAGLSVILPFLPLLAKQILLNNFLSDIPGIAIASDAVDREWIDTPRRWDIKFIRRFMILFGLVSSFFDFLTFGMLLIIFNSSPEQFRTGWFIESLLTELIIALVVRTRRPFYRSTPGKWLWISTVIVGVITLALPYVPAVNTLFDFVPLPFPIMAALIGITGLYIVATEFAKKAFYGTINKVNPVGGSAIA